MEVFIAVGLDKLKHNGIDLFYALLFETLDSKCTDLIVSLLLVREGTSLWLIDGVGREQVGKEWESLIDIDLGPSFKHAHTFKLFLLFRPVHAHEELYESSLVWH